MEYSFNSEMLHEAKLRLEPSQISHIEPQRAFYSNTLMIVGLSLSVALIVFLSLFNPLATTTLFLPY